MTRGRSLGAGTATALADRQGPRRALMPRRALAARSRSMLAVIAGALAWATMTACNQQTINTPLRSFDRPSDVALTCVQYRPDENNETTRPHGTFEVRPLSDCEPVRAQALGIKSPFTLPVNYLPPMGPNEPFTPFIVALVTQSARGELALVDAAQNRLIDADPYKPGYGFVPVGKLPEHIRSSTDGCWAVTANTDSCDLSKVNIPTVLHGSLLSLFPADLAAGSIAASGVTSLPLTVPSHDAGGKAGLKTLYARPSWIEMAPPGDAGGQPSTHGYEAGGTPGTCSGGDHRAWVALPACQLVVKVHLEVNPESDADDRSGAARRSFRRHGGQRSVDPRLSGRMRRCARHQRRRSRPSGGAVRYGQPAHLAGLAVGARRRRRERRQQRGARRPFGHCRRLRRAHRHRSLRSRRRYVRTAALDRARSRRQRRLAAWRARGAHQSALAGGQVPLRRRARRLGAGHRSRP